MNDRRFETFVIDTACDPLRGLRHALDNIPVMAGSFPEVKTWLDAEKLREFSAKLERFAESQRRHKPKPEDQS